MSPGDPRYVGTPLGVAWTQLGVHEVGGKNRGPRVDEYIRGVGLEPDPVKNPKAPKDGYHWCTAFAIWCVRKAGKSIKASASVARLWELNQDLAVLEPEPSDIAIHLNDDGTGHCGIVDNKDATHIQTIDGNTNAQGSRVGDRVAFQSRLRIYWHGFLRPRGM
jgi:hypothetical protein